MTTSTAVRATPTSILSMKLVVPDAVLDDDPGRADFLGHPWADLIGMRIDIGVALDGDDMDVPTADLAGHIAVFVLGGHHAASCRSTALRRPASRRPPSHGDARRAQTEPPRLNH